jgi:polysaccharide export outer membrane protein
LVLALACTAWGQTPAQQGYGIGPRDILRIVVIGQNDLTADFQVDSEGMLTLPLLGKVKAADFTAQELEKKLTTLLADGYLKKPEVSVSVKEFRSQLVFVTGAVPKPGFYPLRSDRSLLSLIADVGGGGGDEVMIHRGSADPVARSSATVSADIPTDIEGGAPVAAVAGEEIRVNLRQLVAGDLEQNAILQGGDTVTFLPPRQVYVTGNVVKPGAYRFQDGMTVFEALAAAGGVTARGSAGRTKVQRMVEEDGQKKRVEVRVKADDVLQPEDTLVVPERFF